MFPQKVGRYEVKAELGRGGMATVYRAYDPRFKRYVAVKVLPRQFLHDPQFLKRFEREAQTIAALEHSAIVPVYDFGEDAETGQPYIVMRLMTGGTLADRLKDGPLPLPDVARIFNQLASALDKAHSKGVIHRDLKPGNILFDEDDNPCITDFGIVKLSEATATFTGSGVIGTPAYMSPEQARGERDIDRRSDIYTLGTILFQMLTGKLPYEADTPMGLAIKHLIEPPPHILDTRPDLPPACEDLIQRAMAKERGERFSTASGLADALTSIATGALSKSTHILGAAESPAKVSEQSAFRLHRRGWLIFGLIALIILTFGAAFWFVRNPDRLLILGFKQASPTLAPTHTPSTFLVEALPASPTQKPTSTLSPTPTLSSTPTASLTPTLRPTRAPTRQPAWINDFAEPILAAIAGRKPDFQDDFSMPSDVWEDRCEDWQLKYIDQEMIASGCSIAPDVWYTDFVVAMDFRLLPGERPDQDDDALFFHFRQFYSFTFSADGDMRFEILDESRRITNAFQPDQSAHHVRIIVKDQDVGLYIDDRPVYYGILDPGWKNGSMSFRISDRVGVGFDNFKIWDISDVSPAGTPVP